jgi:fatty-acid peroxygenase
MSAHPHSAHHVPQPLPGDSGFDRSLDFLSQPYEFISQRCDALGSDVFGTRLLLRKTICMRGAAAAALLSDGDKFMRHGAAPQRLQKTLLGKTGVQTLDGPAHEHRKQLFMSLMSSSAIAQLLELTAQEWRRAIQSWRSRSEIVLYDELHVLLTRAVCAWAGVPIRTGELERRVEQLTAMFDAAGAVGVRHWRSRRARAGAERWISRLIAEVRRDRLVAPSASALYRIAHHRDLDGELLPLRTAAVELLNVLRPTVAVSVFIVFVAHALHRYAHCRDLAAAGDEQYLTWFIQEVRRFYPFFPAVPARVRRDFEWRGWRFPANTRVLLDLYGTNHDPRSWERPERFEPARFAQWQSGMFDFIPQGPATHVHHHRCPGEWITIELMKQATHFLLHEMRYEVPPQNLEIDVTRLPALPRSGMKLRVLP